MARRQIQAFTLAPDVIQRVQSLVTEALTNPLLVELLNLSLPKTDPADKRGLTVQDYEKLKGMAMRRDLEGDKLIAYVMQAPATRHIATKYIRTAIRRSTRSAASSKLSGINQSRIIEALIRIGMETLDARINHASRKNGDAAKVEGQRAVA